MRTGPETASERSTPAEKEPNAFHRKRHGPSRLDDAVANASEKTGSLHGNAHGLPLDAGLDIVRIGIEENEFAIAGNARPIDSNHRLGWMGLKTLGELEVMPHGGTVHRGRLRLRVRFPRSFGGRAGLDALRDQRDERIDTNAASARLFVEKRDDGRLSRDAITLVVERERFLRMRGDVLLDIGKGRDLFPGYRDDTVALGKPCRVGGIVPSIVMGRKDDAVVERSVTRSQRSSRGRGPARRKRDSQTGLRTR